MIFEYDELKECVPEDFERFYKMGSDEKQVFPAVLIEYEHGEDDWNPILASPPMAEHL